MSQPCTSGTFLFLIAPQELPFIMSKALLASLSRPLAGLAHASPGDKVRWPHVDLATFLAFYRWAHRGEYDSPPPSPGSAVTGEEANEVNNWMGREGAKAVEVASWASTSCVPPTVTYSESNYSTAPSSHTVAAASASPSSYYTAASSNLSPPPAPLPSILQETARLYIFACRWDLTALAALCLQRLDGLFVAFSAPVPASLSSSSSSSESDEPEAAHTSTGAGLNITAHVPDMVSMIQEIYANTVAGDEARTQVSRLVGRIGPEVEEDSRFRALCAGVAEFQGDFEAYVSKQRVSNQITI